MMTARGEVIDHPQGGMRIAALSDIHGNLQALDAVMADLVHRSVHVTVNLGDLLSGGLQPRETADRLLPLLAGRT